MKQQAVRAALLKEQARRGINQTQAAETIGVSRAVYSRWVSGRGFLPSIGNLQGVADFLGLDERSVLALFPADHRLRTARVSPLAQMADVLADVRDLRAEVAELAKLVEEFLRQ